MTKAKTKKVDSCGYVPVRQKVKPIMPLNRAFSCRERVNLARDFMAGKDISELAVDYRAPIAEVEDVLRKNLFPRKAER